MTVVPPDDEHYADDTILAGPSTEREGATWTTVPEVDE